MPVQHVVLQRLSGDMRGSEIHSSASWTAHRLILPAPKKISNMFKMDLNSGLLHRLCERGILLTLNDKHGTCPKRCFPPAHPGLLNLLLLFLFSLHHVTTASCCIVLISTLFKSAYPWDHMRGVVWCGVPLSWNLEVCWEEKVSPYARDKNWSGVCSLFKIYWYRACPNCTKFKTAPP